MDSMADVCKDLKAQFKPLPKEEGSREQIWKLTQKNNVHNCIYCFRELENDIPPVNSIEAYNLFMHGLNPQLCQLVSTLVDFGNLDQVIEVVKRAIVYGKDKRVAGTNRNENQNKKG